MILPDTLRSLIRKGANITIEGKKYMPETLVELVTFAKNYGVHVTITAEGYMPDTLERLARIGKNNLTIET